jgi:hypothetical protein
LLYFDERGSFVSALRFGYVREHIYKTMKEGRVRKNSAPFIIKNATMQGAWLR